MKLERSNVDHPLWRKKVDSSLFAYKGTTIPTWACNMWKIQSIFKGCNSKKLKCSEVKIRFNKKLYSGWVTEAKEGRMTSAYRLWFEEDLLFHLKYSFIMSFMRDIESRLQPDKSKNIEDEIPFWEFLDIEFDNNSRLFLFTSYYTQSPAFPELFKRLVASPIMKKIDDETGNKAEKDRIYKQDWKPRSEYETELGAENVIYMLLDTVNKLFYIGETRNLIKRFNQGHKEISTWDFNRYDVLPDSLNYHRVTIERMLIRDFSTIFINNLNIETKSLSSFTLANKKIDIK